MAKFWAVQVNWAPWGKLLEGKLVFDNALRVVVNVSRNYIRFLSETGVS